MSDHFTIAFGQALALVREDEKIFVVVNGDRREISMDAACRIGDDFIRTARNALRCKLAKESTVDPVQAARVFQGRLGGETCGDD